MQTKNIFVVTKKASNDEGEFVIASTDFEDRHHDIVDQETLIIKHYIKNPVLLYNHNQWDHPIGKTTDIGFREFPELAKGRKFLSFKPVFDMGVDPVNERARLVERQWREGFIYGVSIGFLYGKLTRRNLLPKEHRHYGELGYLLQDCELAEISITPIPSNRESQKQSKSYDDDLETRVRAIIEEIIGEKSDRASPAKTDDFLDMLVGSSK